MTATTGIAPPSTPPVRRHDILDAIRTVTDNRVVRFVAITIAVAAFGYFVPQWIWGWDMPAGVLSRLG